MKIVSNCFRRGMWYFVVLCLLSLSVQATDRLEKFSIPQSQIKLFGIQVLPLDSKNGTLKASYPAEVIIPPNAEQIVSSPVTGMVTEILVLQNQVVSKSAPLMKIASPELGQLQLQLLQANSRATLARQTAKREQQLFDEGIIPQRRIQEAQAELAETAAALNQAKAALRFSGMSSSMIEKIAISGHPQDSITLTAAKAGIVTEILAKPGQRVEAATALLHVAQTEALWLEIQVPVTESAQWLVNSQLRIQGKDLTARVLSTSASVSSNSQSIKLYAAIEGNKAKVRPGEFLTVELPLSANQNGWDVPLSAVAHDGNQAYLFVRTADGFIAKQIKVISSAGQRVRVQGALKPNAQIAISGVVALKGAWLADKGDK